MDNEDEEFNFDGIDFTKVAFDEMARLMVPMYQAFRNRGLSATEAAALTANYWIANAAQASEPEGPQDGS